MDKLQFNSVSCTYFAQGVSPRFGYVADTLAFNFVHQVSGPSYGLSGSAASRPWSRDVLDFPDLVRSHRRLEPQPASVPAAKMADMASAAAFLLFLIITLFLLL